MYRLFNTRSDKDRVRSWYMNLPRSPDTETFELCKLFLTFIIPFVPAKAKHRKIWKDFSLPRYIQLRTKKFIKIYFLLNRSIDDIAHDLLNFEV